MVLLTKYNFASFTCFHLRTRNKCTSIHSSVDTLTHNHKLDKHLILRTPNHTHTQLPKQHSCSQNFLSVATHQKPKQSRHKTAHKTLDFLCCTAQYSVMFFFFSSSTAGKKKRFLSQNDPSRCNTTTLAWKITVRTLSAHNAPKGSPVQWKNFLFFPLLRSTIH